ncbi:filamentous hemagglutinin N-terminal domain-containing protein [Yersinia canariae]|uniref:Filamentous hemagglutinin N-terminal domain-containing protein n=1 Tax=Yersinia canariae TaxID=2607663 RepID=A0A857F6H1_9GAMM|nr:filamentous hemagglutinin N-terminal domain-containing protein [Yersinia canariae]QHB34442.1 filamentous hemagglutinin N-terminal domain-containing protein [Yersinia canariae]
MIFINGLKRRRLSALPLSIMLSLCGISVSHATNIIADVAAPSGQQADIKIEAQTLLPVPCRSVMGCGEKTTINIQSPDKNGLSHNKYTKFDAPHINDVVILNNNLSNESNGNPNLVNSAAKIILNEVRSPQASLLNGSVTLSGQDAHVIIANPSGIDCNGCSFTNISHLTLTTGSSYFSHNNKLLGFKVWDGKININRGKSNNPGLSHKGRDKGSAYLDLFTNSLEVRGYLQADDLFVIAGKHKIRLASPGEKMGLEKLVAYLSPPDDIDSANVRNMDGMYANKIRIIAEENIINRNVIQSKNALQMVSGGNIENSFGANITAGTVLLYSGGVLHNVHGKIKASNSNDKSTMNIVAKRLFNNYGKIHSHGKSIKIDLDNPIENHKGDIAIIGKINKKQLKV